MPYRISDESVQALQADYKKKYRPFRPFKVDPLSEMRLGTRLRDVLSTQNGMDTDDYAVEDNNKVERYIGLPTRGNKLLILGTGTGREMIVAKDLGWDTWGTTLGSRNIDYAVDHLGIDRLRLLECANESLPFEKESFDIVTGFQVFEHTISPLLFLLEQGRVLKYGGELILEWPPAARYTMGDNPHHQICFTPGQAKALLEKAGFTNVYVQYNDGEMVREEDMWDGNQTCMLLVTGTKTPTDKEYINKVWNS